MEYAPRRPLDLKYTNYFKHFLPRTTKKLMTTKKKHYLSKLCVWSTQNVWVDTASVARPRSAVDAETATATKFFTAFFFEFEGSFLCTLHSRTDIPRLFLHVCLVQFSKGDFFSPNADRKHAAAALYLWLLLIRVPVFRMCATAFKYWSKRHSKMRCCILADMSLIGFL